MEVAVLGTGLMGAKICKRLVSCGNHIRAWNRTPEKALELAEAGVRPCTTTADAVRGANVILLMLSDAHAIRDVLLSDPVTKELVSGKEVLQMGTIGTVRVFAFSLCDLGHFFHGISSRGLLRLSVMWDCRNRDGRGLLRAAMGVSAASKRPPLCPFSRPQGVVRPCCRGGRRGWSLHRGARAGQPA
ncbi:hypothetical protein VaNZ11_012376 [Volvox africanus]|uniref:6-phosphogluconate dehydrogenase NADP-binding domain-containing protein n=1 Tax=Volvox africanus TaxID=51714 RepID=A0ABQ5SDX6_9CHLO|nr:hypothetical protein VaNZ11_012376 [Volvox africanus]